MTRPFKVNSDELELPETVYIRDIEDRVFQMIVLQCLAKIPGISLVEGNFIDHLLGRGGMERLKGVVVEQNDKTRSVSIRVEVNVCYDVSIPEKSDEIQKRVTEEITRLTGLHVARVHVVFKGVSMTPSSKGELQEAVLASERPE